MATLKHTPPPWRFEPALNGWQVRQGQFVVAAGTAWGIPDLQPEAAANGRLIAAAPAMYELLRAVIDTARDDPNPRAFDALLTDIDALLDNLEGK